MNEAAQLHPVLRWGGRLLLLILIPYGIVLLIIFLSQRSLIFPGSASQDDPSYNVAPPPGSELLRLNTPSGETVAALFGAALTPEGKPHPQAGQRPTLLFFYGNGDSLSGNLDPFMEFRRLGVNVLIPEYVGYGMSGGKASESGCYATADAAYEYLLTRNDVNPKKIVAVGWSLGGGVAVDLASRKPVAGLAAFSTFSSVTDMAQRLYPYFPVRLLLLHRFESERKMARVKCPVLLGHGKLDTMIPPSMMDRLTRAASGPVTMFYVEDAGHNDFFAVGSDEIDKELKLFLERLPEVRR